MANEFLKQSERFNQEHRVGEGERIAYGFMDGGRQLKFDENGNPASRPTREILVVKSPDQDPVLKQAIEVAKRDMSQMRTVEDKAKYLTSYTDRLMKDYYGTPKALDRIAGGASVGKEVSLGQMIEAGVGQCRHRALLFKVLADETGVPCALVRGRYVDGDVQGPHAWNEVKLEDGKRLLVDPTNKSIDKMDSPRVQAYRDLNERPLYSGAARIVPPSRSAVADVRDNLAKLPTVETVGKGTYIDIGKMSEPEINQLKKTLAQNHIEFNEKNSSLNGGTRVLALTGANEERFRGIIGGKYDPVVSPAIKPVTPDSLNSRSVMAALPTIPSNKGLYIDVNAMEPENLENLRKLLSQNGIDYSEKESSLNGGTKVLALTAEGEEKFKGVLSGKIDSIQPPTKPPVVNTTSSRPYLEAAQTIRTSKGLYIDVNAMKPDDIDNLKAALSRNGIEFRERTSAINGGTKVLALSQEGQERFNRIKAGEFEAALITLKPSTQVQFAEAAAPTPTPKPQAPATLAMAAQFEKAAPDSPSNKAAVDIDLRDPAKATAQSAKPAAVDIDIGAPVKSIMADVGSKVDKGMGRTSTSLYAGAQLSEGNVAGAAATVAAAEAQNKLLSKGVQFIGKRVPGIGAIITVGATLWSAGAQAAQGNLGKAAAELTAGVAEAAGNVVGFGAGDALREGVRAGVVAIAGEKYAPEKSGIREAAEVAYGALSKKGDAAASAPSSAGATANNYSNLSRAQLAEAIQKDPTLMDTAKLNDKEMPLSKALEDKTFRTEFIKNLESAQAKGHDLKDQIAMVKAYDKQLVAPAPAATTPAPATASLPSLPVMA
ncbi:MAG: hypothetical protein HYS17_07745 [Micavibrio aeruginosavorus]|uniref:Transglutaminase-like domain-containing protein n=1 Tax=Micavibrio aeruginosavorus TaxID=349221 RepID=A0A7T5R0T3_9BACT|nr:MAG: hypothetical protein HYS17_07745 [Micavibrio aeruginosavorus]